MLFNSFLLVVMNVGYLEFLINTFSDVLKDQGLLRGFNENK